jgi:hypothetical protein
MSEPISAAFAAGYERGRADGERQAISVMKMYFEMYPHGAIYEPGDPTISEVFAVEIRTCIRAFGETQHAEGRRHQRKLTEEKDAKKPPPPNAGTR